MTDNFYKRSACCGAPVSVGGEDSEELEEGQTHYFVCSACDNECDLADD